MPALRGGAFRFRLDCDGQQHFNFSQCIWISASVPMAFTQAPSKALTTLALNMICLASSTRVGRGRVPSQRRKERRLARQFALTCLLTAPAGGWVIPRQVVTDWIDAHSLLSRGAVRSATRAPTAIGPV